nr:putative ribonuclease H-like domain-containing protein [Tanacetum cinerariifolium]
MRPFGCHVTILNTLDNLGKLDDKADEGFFVGYSMNSKTFRVFNSRTRIVEETMHITFLEIKPNVAGSGPTWLFDIDTLTKSMNYKPVVAENKSNGKLFDSCTSKVDSEPPHGSNVDIPNIHECKQTLNVSVGYDVDKNIVYGCADDLNMPNLEEIVYSDDDEDVGAEAGMTNLDTNITVSLIPTSRIYKDHPVKQIIRDIHSTPQTRRMTKSILVDLLYGKRAIGTKWIYINKKDERGIVVRNKVRLVAHGYTQEEGIDYDEVFALVSRIEAIRLFLAYASFKDFVVYQIDVKSAFLYGKIKEEVYVCQPLGFEDPKFPDRVYKVEKALYGLHQALRACEKDAKDRIEVNSGNSSVNAAEHYLVLPVNFMLLSYGKALGWWNQVLMYPMFIQVFMDKQLDGMSKHNSIYVIPSHTKKLFSNTRRVGKDFSGRDTPLFSIMLMPAQEEKLDVTPDELTMAQALVEIKKLKPKGATTTLQAEFDEQDRLAKEKAQQIEDENLAWDNVQVMMDADYELAARLQEEEQGELTIKEKSRLFVELMDKRKKHFTKVRAEEKRRKPLTKA